ncbi:hypothetical protein [Gimesia maris]|uniref:GAF domain-containing protein n=1 Tax=Gimesia maris TaxID=122 RepID=A0ABX5YLR5_9PLAN|nr:hypothetical protein [Gimesia maris]EDL57686.1 hypothetical protein PM8797T_31875 [Gimesia maris DSM 8797]QEG16634.1 hypothetical protein GmarT_25000 [Gimesia maris]QGQ30200.1 hypothetical protein F1729_16940 [Gimesia maris]
MQQQFTEIMEQFESVLQRQRSISDVLDRLMEVLGGRAIGLWRCQSGKLVQLGFRADSQMDEQVKREFSALTQEVSLKNTGLGIVKAVIDQKPAIGTLQAKESGLQGSSEWLQKFDAKQSYAIPIIEGDQAIGVLAISTNQVHQAGDPEWELQAQIAREIGAKQFLGMF